MVAGTTKTHGTGTMSGMAMMGEAGMTAGKAGMRDGRMMSSCPMAAPGATVTASDVDGGATLTFTTATGDVSDLRRRVHQMADMHRTGCPMMAAHEHGASEDPAAERQSHTEP